MKGRVEDIGYKSPSQARQCAVEELLQNEPLFFQLQSLLPQLVRTAIEGALENRVFVFATAQADLDALLGRLTLTPRGDGTADWCKASALLRCFERTRARLLLLLFHLVVATR